LKGEGVTAAVSGAGRTKLEDDLTSGVHASVGDGEGPYRFGKNRGWASGCFFYWAETVPLGLLFFSPFLSLFLFGFFLFLFLSFAKSFKAIQTSFKSNQTSF
jgi:hypothetical protein